MFGSEVAFLVGYPIPRKKSPSPKNPHPQKIQGIKIPRFRRIPNQRDKNPKKSHPTKKSHPSDNESAENPGKNR